MCGPLGIAQVIFTVGSLMLYQSGNCQQNVSEVDYAKLELNTKELLGSRWALEQADKNNTVTIFHSFQIVDIVKVDVNDMSVRVDFNMRQRWEAVGLDLPKGLFKTRDKPGIFISADESVLNSVWSPDSYITSARETKILSVTTTQSAVNIYENNTIVYKARMYATLGCSFTFHWYPLDIQVCDLVFESYKYTTQTVHYRWEPSNPLTIADNIILYQYDFLKPPKISEGSKSRWTGMFNYPHVKITFRFERKLGNNVIQIFIPTILVVILSFFSFWLGMDAVPGRISLLVTCILTLVTMHSSLRGIVPAVHYVKMMDIWLIGCMIFVFGAICEFILVKYMKWRTEQIENAKKEQERYLKKNRIQLQQNFHPGSIPAQGTLNLHNNGRNNMMHNNIMRCATVYPEFEQHPYVQTNRNLEQPLSNSAYKRQAWATATQQQTLGMQPEYNMHQLGVPRDYPGFVNMHGIYNPHFMLPPPPASPGWTKIDKVCRIIFPILFAIFNAVYWPVLLVGSSKQHLDE